MSEKIIEFQDVSISYGTHYAVRNCSFEINENEIFGLLGPNGAGKSTLIRALLGQLDYEGNIFIMGEELTRIPREKLNDLIGVIPQEPCFLRDFTVYENLKFAGKLYRLPNIEEIVEDSISKFLLSNYRDKPVKFLSGGYKRLVSIAMSTIHDPHIIVMDEPTVGLDASVRNKIWEIIKKLNKEGKTVILTTHYLDEASLLCDRIAIINNGYVLSYGPPPELIEKYGGNTRIFLNVDKDPSPLLNSIKKIPNIIEVKISGKLIEIECKSKYAAHVIRDVVLVLEAPPHRIKPLRSEVREPTLSDAFMKIVGSEIGL